MLIFVIVIIAYGVTSQALMYMHFQRDPYPLVFRDIFYYPYWSLAGELYLDEMQGVICYSEPFSGLKAHILYTDVARWCLLCHQVSQPDLALYGPVF